MIKLRNDVLINESQILAAEYKSEDDSRTLILTFVAPIAISFTESARKASNQIRLLDDEAESVWKVISKNAYTVTPKTSGRAMVAPPNPTVKNYKVR